MLMRSMGIALWFLLLLCNVLLNTRTASFLNPTKTSTNQHKTLFIPNSAFYGRRRTPPSCRKSSPATAMQLSWFQDLVPEFLKKREGDFIRLDESANVFGPGPLILLYNVPSSIDDQEFQNMIADGAPSVAGRCALHRIEFTPNSRAEESRLSETTNIDMPASLLATTVEEALERILKNPSLPPTITQQEEVMTTAKTLQNGVLLFSGFSSNDMMAVYKIMAEQIYEETGGMNSVACAKVVPKAMHKPLGQVFEEISGDHQDAIKST